MLMIVFDILLRYTLRMTILNPSSPERFTTLVYPSHQQPTYVSEVFEDPDYIQLHLGDKKDFDIRWTTNASSIQSLELLSEFIVQSDFTSGTITLRHAFDRPDTLVGGANVLNGDAEDIMNEVHDAGDRVIGYSLTSKSLELHYSPSWPKTYHDIRANEIVLKMRRTNNMARYIIGQAISLTALEGLRNSADNTLAEFATYLPVLRR